MALTEREPGAATGSEPARDSGQVAARRRDDSEIVIRPARGWAPLNLHELLAHRQLLYLLTWRNIKVRYKQTALGAAWAVIPSVLTMLVFTVIFGHLGKLSSDGAPYALFSFCALVPWTFFSSSISLSSGSIVENERLVTKVYFPRLLIPLAATIVGLLDLAIAFVLLVILAFAFGVYPDLSILAIPPLVVLACAAALAIGLILSALNVFYRDVKYVIAFLIQFWLFVTPVAYASSIIPKHWQPVYGLNPMTGVIDGFRWAMLDTAFPWSTLPVSIASAIVLLVASLYYFRRVEDTFADVV